MLTFVYRVAGAEGLKIVEPLWQKLRAFHTGNFVQFASEKRPFSFEARTKEILGKAGAGRLRIEIVSLEAEPMDVAYAISSITSDGRGEVDSMFVDERYRGLGIGSELMRRAMAWFDGVGTSSRVVTVAYGNEHAVALYQRFGFHPRTVLLQQLQKVEGTGASVMREE